MRCIICLNGTENITFLNCNHFFCLKCVLTLISKRSRKYPMCRTPITHTKKLHSGKIVQASIIVVNY